MVKSGSRPQKITKTNSFHITVEVMGIRFRDTNFRLQKYQKICCFTISLKLKMTGSLFFIWAARLPPVAVGLSAVLASLVPLLSLPRRELETASAYSMLLRKGRASVPAGGGLMALPAAIFLRPFRCAGMDYTHAPFRCRRQEATESPLSVLPRHACRQVLSSNQRAAGGRTLSRQITRQS